MRFTILLAAAFALLVPMPAFSADKAAPSLRAGAAAVDVSPKLFPLNMPGGFNANMADGVNDPLFARAVALDDGANALAIVVVDNLGVAQEVCDEAKALAAKRCGLAADKILISSTHTHSAPSSNSKEGPPPAVAYRKVLLDGIVEAIVKAHAALRPATAGAAAHPLPDEVSNRRWHLKPGKMPLNPFGQMDAVKMNPGTSPDVLDRPAGPTDPDVTILSLQDAKTRKPLALLANYSLHYVGAPPRNKVSADYYGEFVRLMQYRVGGDEAFVAMMSNGTSGDINNIPFLKTRPPRAPFEQICIVAQKAADAAWFARAAIDKHRGDVRLGMRERQVTLKLRRPTQAQIAAAKAVLAVKDPAAKEKLPRLADNYARRTLSLAEGAESITVPLQAIKIGDLAVCAIPFETFAEIGLELKKRCPFPRTMVISIANGGNGYLPTPRQHKLGGYETWLGTNRVQEDASEIIIANHLEMLKELRQGL